MQSKLEELLKQIGLPITVAAVIASVAGYFGLPLEQAFSLFGILSGLPFVLGLLIDLLKQVGVVKPGDAGKWSAGFNLAGVIALTVLLKVNPSFDVPTWDAQLLEIAKAVVIVITWVLQLFGTQGAHYFFSRSLGIKPFSFRA